MCVTCGCGEDAKIMITQSLKSEEQHTHTLPDGTVVVHSHDHEPEHSHHLKHSPDLATETSQVASSLHAQVHRTTLTLEQNLLAKNDLIAIKNRAWFQSQNILALNLVSSPGSGKTTLLVRTIQDLQKKLAISVIEGDQETINDAERIRATGCQAVQINIGTGCHLEAAMVEHGVAELKPLPNSLLMIENVGNLVCPALFDLGEAAKVAILSVTEGEDKPLKYPHMFRAAEVMILNKIDLLPYVTFDRDRCLEYARQVNPRLQIFQVS
ncbi:MAG: hydrogenase nickel incorporation protein HypB, partial [Microcystaceae cyanobacterium]